jgi:cytoskeletal protein RodZ
MSQTIGEYLKQVRSKRQLTLEEAAESTHIRLRYLQALENDQRDIFPSEVHARGFLRNYTDYLDIPVQPMLDAWQEGIVSFPPPTDPISEEMSDVSDAVIYLDDETSEVDKHAPTPTKRDTSTQEDFDDLPLTTTGSQAAESIFDEIGDTLKNQRESLGLTLNDVEHYTHVRLHYLQTIENGNFKELPSSVQGRGMIEIYARFLDIDADKLLLRFADGLQAQHADRVAKEKTPASKKKAKKPRKTQKASSWKRFLTPDLLIGSSVILVLVIFAIWSTSQVISKRNKESASTIPVVAETSLQSPAGQIDEVSTEISMTTPSPVDLISMTVTPESFSPGQTELPIVPTTSILDGTATETLPVIDNAPLQVYVVARQRAYLKVVVDNIVEFEGRVVSGNAYPFSGDEKIELVTGNAAALQIIFNQNDLGTVGAFGQVASLIFTNQGVVTPTAMFTVTATHTLPATITLEPTATPITPTVTPLIP